MNRGAVWKFFDKVEKDQGFAIKATEFKQVKELVRFAREAGFDFTETDFIQATKFLKADWRESDRCTMRLKNSSGERLKKEKSLPCPVCWEKLLFEETGVSLRWYCQCGKYEKIAMNEWQPNRYNLPSRTDVHVCPKKCMTEIFCMDHI